MRLAWYEPLPSVQASYPSTLTISRNVAGSQAVKRTETMDGKPTPRRVRAFRITDRRSRVHVQCIGIEDVDRGWFMTPAFSGRGHYTRAIKSMMDRLDAWNVLNRLRDDDCFPDAPTEMPPDDSIDAAVEQPISRIREHFQGKVPAWAKKQPPIDQQSRPVVIGLSREVSSEE